MTSNPAIIPFDGQMVTTRQRTILEAIETHWRGHYAAPTVREIGKAVGLGYLDTYYTIRTLWRMSLVAKETKTSRTLRTARTMVSTVLYKGEPYQAIFWGDGGYEMKELAPIVKQRAEPENEEPAKVGKKS